MLPASLVAADPEMREYLGQCFTDDVPVGQMSDVAQLTRIFQILHLLSGEGRMSAPHLAPAAVR